MTENSIPHKVCTRCNQSKNRIMPDVWLIQKYGEQKGNEILARINGYFEWVKTQDSEP